MVKRTHQKLKDAQITKKVGNAATSLQNQSSRHFSKHITKRAKRVVGSRRFIAGWLLLILLVGSATIFSSLQLRTARLIGAAQNGGVYTEGIVGSVNNLNPLFGGGAVDDSATHLLFNGLLRYDQTGKLTTDLATRWRLDKDRTKYIVDLKENVQWHDGEPFTADDVVYTITTIQKPETRSALFTSWQGVKVAKTSEHRVTFELPAPFTPFTNALTVPIVPRHALEHVEPSRLRSSEFNAQPVGTGPFVFSALRSRQGADKQLELLKNDDYHHSRPRVDKFIIRSFEEPSDLGVALRNREITAAVGLGGSDLDELTKDQSVRLNTTPLNSGVFAFFNMSNSTLKSSEVRRALVASVDRQSVLDLFDTRYAPLKTPLLPFQFGYDRKYEQRTNLPAAKRLLTRAGWKRQADGDVRIKNRKELKLSLVTVDNAEYVAMAKKLKQQWEAVGVTIETSFLSPDELQNSVLSANAYDILLYGISIGHDPDVYAYWHSSQAKPGGLNFSQWESAQADTALEAGRTRSEAILRRARYASFLDEWQKAAPAVALYQPRTNYVYHQNARGFVSFPANSAAERLTNVEDWTVNTRAVERTP